MAATMASVRLPRSPSDLAETLANISLDDRLKDSGDDSGLASSSSPQEGNVTVTDADQAPQKDLPPVPRHGLEEEEEDVDGSSRAIADTHNDIQAGLEQIRAHFFVIQEKRHAGVFALVENTKGANTARAGMGLASSAESTPVKAAAAAERAIAKTSTGSGGSAASEKNVALDMAMVQLNTYMENMSEKFILVERQLAVLSTQEKAEESNLVRSRRGSMSSLSSLSSLDSFDDAFGLSLYSSKALKPEELRKRHLELSVQWSQIQRETKALEEELSADKYNAVFQTIGEQLDEMMDSLDKALGKCHEFVFQFNRDQQRGDKNGTRDPSTSLYESSNYSSDDERLVALQAIKRTFSVKRSSYTPACEQMLTSLERGITQRHTQNGTILRRFSELKVRWRTLRERISRMDKELKQIEAHLQGRPVPTPSPAGAQRRPSPRTNRGSLLASPSSPSILPQSVSMADLTSTSMPHLSPLSSGTPRRGVHDSSPLTPVNRRRQLSSTYDGLPRSPSHNILSAGGNSQEVQSQARLRPASMLSTPPRGQSSTSTRIQPRSVSPQMASTAQDVYTRLRSTSTASSGSRQSQRHSMQMGSSTPPVARSGKYRAPSMGPEATPVRQAGAAHGQADLLTGRLDADTERPSSAAGMYYRPPSASGHRDDAGMSRIPRLSIGAARDRRSSIVGDRPGSAMSYASRHGVHSEDREAALRQSMQTPEPTILARAQRANLFSGPAGGAKRSSRPPPSRYNAGGRASLSARPSMGGSESATASGPYSSTNQKQQQQQWSYGRTTPLSAAALAKVPDAQPTVDGFETPQRRTHSGARTSLGGSSVASFRAHRAAASQSIGTSKTASGGPHSRGPSIQSGRVTPTFSDGGQSSMWGGTAYSGRMSRAGTSIGGGSQYGAPEPYRPNPSDAIDVEVARVANGLGIHIERVDAPLPRGVKDLDPKSTKLVKYAVGGKQVTVKLLQLHKPAAVSRVGAGPQQEKAKKLLTRVGGGWIDFESYLLSRMGTL